jgi:hypothetical protein
MSASSTVATWLFVPDAREAVAGPSFIGAFAAPGGAAEAPAPRPTVPMLPRPTASGARPPILARSLEVQRSSRWCARQSGWPSRHSLNAASPSARISFTRSAICSAEYALQLDVTRRASSSAAPSGSPFIGVTMPAGGGRWAPAGRALRPARGEGAVCAAARADEALGDAGGGGTREGDAQLATSAAPRVSEAVSVTNRGSAMGAHGTRDWPRRSARAVALLVRSAGDDGRGSAPCTPTAVLRQLAVVPP